MALSIKIFAFNLASDFRKGSVFHCFLVLMMFTCPTMLQLLLKTALLSLLIVFYQKGGCQDKKIKPSVNEKPHLKRHFKPDKGNQEHSKNVA